MRITENRATRTSARHVTHLEREFFNYRTDPFTQARPLGRRLQEIGLLPHMFSICAVSCTP